MISLITFTCMFFHAEITEISACATCNPPIVLRNLTSSLANSQLLVSRAESKSSVAWFWATAGGSKFCRMSRYDEAVSRSFMLRHSMNSVRGLPTTAKRCGQRATSVLRAHRPIESR